MAESPDSYIRMVHHLIEKCLVFKMTKEECMETLSKHANINPVITSTVWEELKKENQEFFEAYAKSKEEAISEIQMRERIPKMLSDSNI